MASVLAPPSVEEQQDTLLPYYTSLAEPTPVATKEPPTPTKHLRDYFNGDKDAQSPHRYFNQVMLWEASSGTRGAISPENDTDGTPTLDESPMEWDSAGSPQWLIVETPVCAKRRRVEEDDSTDSDYDSDGTPRLIIVESPVLQKRRRVEEDYSTDLDYNSDGTPQMVIVESPVGLKRRHSETSESYEAWSRKRRRLGPKAF